MVRTTFNRPDEVRDRLPEPGDSPLQHLGHTVAAFAADVDNDTIAVMATSGIYPEGQTGITWGDLAAILDWMDLSEMNLRPNHPAFLPR